MPDSLRQRRRAAFSLQRACTALCIIPLYVLVSLSASSATEPQKGAGAKLVLLISIDGLWPDLLLQADDRGLALPFLRTLLKEGAHASGVRPVLPSLTLPNHASMMTGVSPARHGIVSNMKLEPLIQRREIWYWSASDIRSPTLWHAMKGAKISSAAIDWPSTAFEQIDFNLPMHSEDSALGEVATPGLLGEIESRVGAYPRPKDGSLEADRQRARAARYILEKKHPRFVALHLTALDTVQHVEGPASRSSYDVLEDLDRIVEEVALSARGVAGDNASVLVVSDHGFTRSGTEILLNALFRRRGLIDVARDGSIASYRAVAWSAGGVAAVMLSDPNDEGVRSEVMLELKRLADDPDGGIERILEEREISAAGAFPGASFLLNAKPGFKFGMGSSPPFLRPTRGRGSHGHIPNRRELLATFIARGPGIPPGKDLGELDMRDIAPTIAEMLDIPFPSAEGRSIFNRSAALPARRP